MTAPGGGGLVLVPVNRLGTARAHYAEVPERLVQPGQRLGHPCDVVYAPVVVLCGRTLRSVHPLLVIPGGDDLASWYRARRMCEACATLAAAKAHAS